MELSKELKWEKKKPEILSLPANVQGEETQS